MSIFNQASIAYSYVKLRWEEPYVSAATNAKMFGVMPPGFYSGFTIGPGGLSNRDVLVSPGSVSGNFGSGDNSDYVSGAFDPSTGFHVAVFQDQSGFQETVTIQPGPASNIHLDATGLEGQKVYIVLSVTYTIGSNTAAVVQLVNAAQIIANPMLMVIGFVNVPVSPSTPLTQPNFGYFDPIYPRNTPYSGPRKGGFLPPSNQVPIRVSGAFNVALPNPAYFQYLVQTILANTTASSFNGNLPPVSLQPGFKVRVRNIGTTYPNVVTLTPNGSDGINGVNSAISIPPGFDVLLESDGINNWNSLQQTQPISNNGLVVVPNNASVTGAFPNRTYLMYPFANNVVFTVPDSISNKGVEFTIKNDTSGTGHQVLFVAFNGTDTIERQDPSLAFLGDFDIYKLVSDGINNWALIGE